MWIVGLISAVIGALLGLFIAYKIAAPLRKMTKVGNRIADGDLDADITVFKTGDEIEDLGKTMGLLIGALKFLKSEKDKGKK